MQRTDHRPGVAAVQPTPWEMLLFLPGSALNPTLLPSADTTTCRFGDSVSSRPALRAALQLLEPTLERPHGDAEDLRGGDLVASDFIEHSADVLPFELRQCRAKRRVGLI